MNWKDENKEKVAGNGPFFNSQYYFPTDMKEFVIGWRELMKLYKKVLKFQCQLSR